MPMDIVPGFSAPRRRWYRAPARTQRTAGRWPGAVTHRGQALPSARRIAGVMDTAPDCPRETPAPRNGLETGTRIRRVFGETTGVAGATPWLTARSDWLRGLDLNQRPLGYEP